MSTRLGLERLADNPQLAAGWGRCGLLTNQAAVTRTMTPAWQICMQAVGKRLTTLFGPQHGFEATVQDNMIETSNSIHQPSGLPIYSLYADTREPTENMLANLDTLIIDLPVTGTRVYTFKYTMAACLRAAVKYDKKIVILDRPNPLGGVKVAGPVLTESCRSFVGEFAIPLKHGLTLGEAARLFNSSIKASLEVITVEDWVNDLPWSFTGLPWVISSPNLPTLDSVFVYPGTVLLEGTNLSEGRGTALPFQFVGAPYIQDPYAFAARVEEIYGPLQGGVFLRPTNFQPTSQKWQGEICQGLQIHIRKFADLRPVDLGLAIIRAGIELGAAHFKWKQPPYEYDYETLPIKLLLGRADVDAQLSAPSFSLEEAYWQAGITEYIHTVSDFLIYRRQMQVEVPQS